MLFVAVVTMVVVEVVVVLICCETSFEIFHCGCLTDLMKIITILQKMQMIVVELIGTIEQVLMKKIWISKCLFL